MRPAQAWIDLEALRHNYRQARQLGGGRALAVIKADAYGHGAVRCAQALQDEADGFAVACIEEAMELRESGIRGPILLLEGFFDADELPIIEQLGLWTVVATNWQVQALANYAAKSLIHVWLKLDSGMHRLGLSPEAFRTAHAHLSAHPHIRLQVMMSHLARADEPGCQRTAEQATLFAHTVTGLVGDTSLSNSAALLAWPQVRGHWARPGLMLYGATPLPTTEVLPVTLKPVMHVHSRVIAVRDLLAGEPVGYGARYVAEAPVRVGVVAMGYADGYPQFAPNGTPVQVDGLMTQVIGQVSMDMLTVDLTHLPHTGVGSPVQLWGDAPSANALAECCKSSAYQLLCGLKRVLRHYR